MTHCPPGFLCLDFTTIVIVGLASLFMFYYLRQGAPASSLSMARIYNPLEPPERTYPSTLDYGRVERLESSGLFESSGRVESLGLMELNRLMERPTQRSPGLPINIPTRGENTGYQQVGILVEENATDAGKKILPLYGEQTFRGSNNWRYYTGTDGFQSVKLPVIHKKKNCQDEMGCDEIYEGDNINILAYEKPYKASLYKIDKPRYIPFV